MNTFVQSMLRKMSIHAINACFAALRITIALRMALVVYHAVPMDTICVLSITLAAQAMYADHQAILRKKTIALIRGIGLS